MAKKRNRITLEMSKTIAETSPLIKSTKKVLLKDNDNLMIDVNLKNLQINPFQPRIDINTEALHELISSIEENGLLQPIIITELEENGFYTIIAGHRRFEAFKILGKSTIPALIKKNIKNKDLAILSLTENLMRENLHPIENAIAIKNILDNKIVESQNKLAQYVGLSKGYVSKLLNILKLPSSIIKIIKDENYKDINILILLNKLDDSDLMIKVYNEIKNLPRKEAEQYIKNLNSKNKNISLVNLKSSKTSISLNVNLKNLKQSDIDLVNSKLNNLNNELIELLNIKVI